MSCFSSLRRPRSSLTSDETEPRDTTCNNTNNDNTVITPVASLATMPHHYKISAALASLAFLVFAQASHFGIAVHLPRDGDCSSRAELQDPDGKGFYVGNGDCKSFPDFRAFGYKYSPEGVDDSPYQYGVCSVSVYSEVFCEGELLLHFPDVSLVTIFNLTMSIY